MDIVFSANNNAEIKVLPVYAPQIEISEPQNNEEFQTINGGTINLIGTMGLTTLSIQSFFPTHEYKWIKNGASSDGWNYVKTFQRWRNERIPVRIVITNSDGKEILNMACTIESFKYAEKKNGDIDYSLDIKEYRFVGV